MSWQTIGPVLLLRDFGRTLGMNRLLALFLADRGYERRYRDGFLAALRQGDCVWDIGANVGHYTKLFADRVGASGRVFAFEPSPVNFERLCAACVPFPNVTLLQVALGKQNGRLRLKQGLDDLGATSRILEAEYGGLVVEVRSGDSLISSGDALRPNAVKIDVEGFEFDVLQGFGGYLESPALRAIGVEIHFGMLKQRGMPKAPREIEDMLCRSGFSVRWPDISHILAVRKV